MTILIFNKGNISFRELKKYSFYWINKIQLDLFATEALSRQK